MPAQPRRLPHALAGLACAALLAGCTADRAAVAPEAEGIVPVPEDFATAPGALPLAQACGELGLPGLPALVERALARSFDLRLRWARLQEAEAAAREAGAARWPSLTVQGGARYSDTVRDTRGTPGAAGAPPSGGVGGDRAPSGGSGGFPGDGTGADLSTGTTTTGRGGDDVTWQATLAASYEVDLWGRLASRARAAELEARARAEDLRTLGISLSANVATAWAQLLAERESLELLEAQHRVARDLLDLVATRFTHGQAGALDLTQQRQELEASRTRLHRAEGRVDTARSQLAVLLAEPPQAFDPPGDARLPDLEGLPDPGVPLALLHRRPDLRAAFLRLEAADARTAAAVAERLPGLRLSADLFGQAAEPGNVLDLLLLQVTGLASQTLFDAGRLEARADQAEARARQALYEYARSLLTALQETADALALEGSRARALASLAEQARIGRERLGLARRRYVAGTVPYLEVLTALQALQRTQRELVDARLGRMTQRVNLCRAAAGPLPGLGDDAGPGSVAGGPALPDPQAAGARAAGAPGRPPEADP